MPSPDQRPIVQLASRANISGFGAQAFPVTTPASVVQAGYEVPVEPALDPLTPAPPAGVPAAGVPAAGLPAAGLPPAALPAIAPPVGLLLELTQAEVRLAASAPKSPRWVAVRTRLLFCGFVLYMRSLRIGYFIGGNRAQSPWKCIHPTYGRTSRVIAASQCGKNGSMPTLTLSITPWAFGPAGSAARHRHSEVHRT